MNLVQTLDYFLIRQIKMDICMERSKVEVDG